MKIILFGITGLGNAVLEELIFNGITPHKVVTRTETGNDPYLNKQNLGKFAKSLDINVEYDVNSASESYELCIVATYHKKINIMESKFLNACNIHPSLLPDLKGRDPISKAIASKYSHTGVTVHELTNQFDTGKIYFSHEVPLCSSDCKSTVLKKMVPIYKLLTKKIIRKFLF